MRDRWDEDELDRGRTREPEPTLGEVIDGAVRKVVTGFVIAGGLIALGIYGSGSGGGGDTVPDYEIVSATDGHVYRLNTDSGSIVACRTASNVCWLMQRGSQDLEDEPPPQNLTAVQPAAPQPVQAAPAQPQAVTAQPAPAQLPAPQNSSAPAPAAR